MTSVATATARNLLGPVLRMGYRVRLTGAHLCPRRGPVLVVAPYAGILDPALISTCLPRPVDALVDEGALASLGVAMPGRIVVAADDPGIALRRAREILGDGGAVAAWAGEGRERAAGYLCSRSRVPVMPVAIVGSAGGRPGDPPPPRSRIEIVLGEPFTIGARAASVSRASAIEAGELIRQRVIDHVRAAGVRMGEEDRPRWGADTRWGTPPDNGLS